MIDYNYYLFKKCQYENYYFWPSRHANDQHYEGEQHPLCISLRLQ